MTRRRGKSSAVRTLPDEAPVKTKRTYGKSSSRKDAGAVQPPQSSYKTEVDDGCALHSNAGSRPGGGSNGRTLEFFFNKTRNYSTDSRQSLNSVITISSDASFTDTRSALSQINEESSDSFVSKTSTEASDCHNQQQHQQAALGSNNIFLQAPVLTLDIDKSLNQASSITINKCLDVGEIFSQLSDRHSIDSDLRGFAERIHSSDSFLIDAESNSSDSGVTSGSSKCLTTSSSGDDVPARQRTPRKPVTPHRILCPSPLKYKTQAVVASRQPSAQQSPSKTNKSRRKLLECDNAATETVSQPTQNAYQLLNSAPAKPQPPKTNSKKTKPTAKKPTKSLKTAPSVAQPNGNRQLTDFFPVRRSVRKPLNVVKQELMTKLERAILEEQSEGLQVAHIEGKGRGVIADRVFERGEFVIEYIGDLITPSEAAEREKNYAQDDKAGCYMYYFKHNNQRYCIDATADSGKLGRLVNHSRNGNLVTKVVQLKDQPHLVLLAKDRIAPGEELCYDYGDRSKESLLHHPWLAY